MHDKKTDFNFVATAIGSVPFQDIEGTCSEILDGFPGMPFWPQFVKRSYLEDMSVQYSEALPLIKVNKEKRTLGIPDGIDIESELTCFYERFLDQDIDYFAMSREYAPGLYSITGMLEKNDSNPDLYIKGQVVGPLTFAAGIPGPDGKPVLHDQEIFEAVINGLSIKALWQVRMLEKTGRRPVLFLDEPYLSGVGSAFSAVQRHDVVKILKTIMGYLREHSDVLIGIHCCGNTDWGMIVDAGPDIINFDAHDYMDNFLLYPDDLKKFIQNKGAIAWGIVPTSGFSGEESIDSLHAKFSEGIRRVYEYGIDPDLLSERSILTPACGMGSMSSNNARSGFSVLSGLSARMGNR